MRIAKTLDDLPVGTPIEIRGGWRDTCKGIVCDHKLGNPQFNPHVVILFSDMKKGTLLRIRRNIRQCNDIGGGQ